MAEKKTSVFALLEILKKASDERHILSQKELLLQLKELYGMELDRRTLYANLDMLESFGYEISRYDQNGRGYYLISRQFEKSEVLLLCNAIHASHFIPQKASRDLIHKLLATQSDYDAADYSSAVYMPNRRKTVNQDLFLNIEQSAQAIRERSCISFQYLHYNMQKQPVPKRAMRYEVQPRYIVYADERAYLICTSAHHPGLYTHYRLDRMRDVQLLDQKMPPLPKDSDPYEYAKNKLFMYSGENTAATLRCDAAIMDQMIDLFGREVPVVPEQDRFVLRISASRFGILYLAQQYLDAMEILDPPELRQELANRLSTALKKYRQKH